jgi:hypothetical protein
MAGEDEFDSLVSGVPRVRARNRAEGVTMVDKDERMRGLVSAAETCPCAVGGPPDGLIANRSA